MEKFIDKFQSSDYANFLIEKYEISELLVKSLKNLLDRVNTYCSRFEDSTKSVKSRYNKVIQSINECIKNPLKWQELLEEDQNLYHISKCYCAVKHEAGNSKNLKLDDIKHVLKEYNDQLKKLSKITIPNVSEFEASVFESSDKLDKEDGLKGLVNLQRQWIKAMTQLEIYFGKSSEYIDKLWIVYDINNLSMESVKYRIYILNKHCQKEKEDLPKSVSTLLSNLLDRYKIGDYGTLKKFIDQTFLK